MCARTDADGLVEAPRRPDLLLKTRKRRDQVPMDTLAAVTSYQCRLLDLIYVKVERVKRHPTVRVLLDSTQPAHVLMLVAVFLVSSALTQLSSASPASPLTRLAYLAAFAIHLGNQFWMTFVSGLALYFNLPRHDFGAVQKVLFPKYFSVNSFLSLVTVLSFTRLHNLGTLQTPEIVQLVVLSACFLLELTIRLYMVPTVVHLITAKTELEVAVGVGREVGYWRPGPLLACPHYQNLHRTFRKQHTLVAVGNIVTMACSSLHLYYLAHHWLCSAE